MTAEAWNNAPELPRPGRRFFAAGGLPRTGWIAFSLLAVAGASIALYLTIVRFTGASIYCAMGDGCEMVNSSRYAKLGPFPVALLGTLWYALLLELGIMALLWGFRWVPLLALGATLFGLGFSSYLTYIEIAVLHAICMWCVASLVVMSGLTLIAIAQFMASRWRSSEKWLPAEAGPGLAMVRRRKEPQG